MNIFHKITVSQINKFDSFKYEYIACTHNLTQAKLKVDQVEANTWQILFHVVGFTIF